MIRKFWQTMWGLWGVGALFDVLSWLCILATGVKLSTTVTAWAALTLPVGFPSLWNLVTPAHAVSRTAVVIILLLQFIQVWLTGGMYGSIVRVNMGRKAAISTFIVDAGKPFGKLLIWSLLWFIVQSTIAVQGGGTGHSALSIAIVMLVVRFLFLYTEVALVAEGQSTFYSAIGQSLRTLTQNTWRSVPVAASLALLTGIAITLTTAVHATVVILLISLVYTTAAVWIMHMLTSRYLVFSNFSARE